MKDPDNDEAFFSGIMKQSKLSVPFTDFEDKIMLRIREKSKKKSTFSREIKLAWIFFITGSTFGIIISIILPLLQEPVLGIYPDKLTMAFQVIFSFLFIIQLDSLKKFYKEQTRKNHG
jgi:hypothetical protein